MNQLGIKINQKKRNLRMRYLLLVAVLFRAGFISAQTDSVRVNDDREDGIYLTYADFRKNIFILILYDFGDI